MANIEKISVSGTSYDVRDASAAHALTDIANAGNNVTFTTPTIDDYSIAGTGVTVTNGVASGFSASSYIYKSISVWNTAISGSFIFQTKFKLNSYSGSDYQNDIISVRSNPYSSGQHRFTFNISPIGRLLFNGSSVSSTTFSTGVDYWIRAVYTYGSSTISVQMSTDGTNFTEIGTPAVYFSTSTADALFIGASDKGSDTQFKGSIDLVETYFKDGNGNVIWAASAPAGKPYINATGGTVDQTYNASSSNAQSGVAINGAGFLKNESTSTTVGAQGLSIGGNNSTNGNGQVVVGFYAGQNAWSYPGGTILPDTDNISVGLGAGSMPYQNNGGGNIALGYLANSVNGIVGLLPGYTAADASKCIAIGSLAHAFDTNAIAIGSSEDGTTTNATEARTYSIAIGTNTKALANNGIAIGRNSSAGSNYSTAVGYQASTTATSSLALGRNAEAAATYAIQLGRGTNSTANTLSVGLSSSDNYTLLESTGTIPAARLGTLPAADGTYIPVLTITGGVPTITWTAYTP